MVCFVFSCFLLNILIPGARQSTALFPDLKPGPGCPGGGDGGGDDDDDNDDDGYPAYSHHDKIPPWWGNVSNDKGGNMSVTKSQKYYWEYIYLKVPHITTDGFSY